MLSFTARPATVPAIKASLMDAEITPLVLFVVVGEPLSAVIVNVVVSVLNGATRLGVGVKTMPRIAVDAASPVPLNVYTPPPALVKPFSVVNDPFAASSSVTLTLSMLATL
jgi:hypothetical protein